MSFESAFDQSGPLRQTIDINYDLEGEKIHTVFKAYVRAEFQSLKASVKAGTPVDTGNLLRNWAFKLDILKSIIRVRITNTADYSNYITSGSSIAGANRFLEEAMNAFETNINGEL